MLNILLANNMIHCYDDSIKILQSRITSYVYVPQNNYLHSGVQCM